MPFILACSGGADSMAVADFYWRGNKNFSIGYFHHNTSAADKMSSVVEEWCCEQSVPFHTSKLSMERPPDLSKEEFWRNQRYAWLLSFNMPIVTAHHIDDVIETWIFSTLHGQSKLIPSKNGNVLRPFLLNDKETLRQWCVEHDVSWIEDQSNLDVTIPRNRIRHNIVPECLLINPGLKKVLRKKILEANSK